MIENNNNNDESFILNILRPPRSMMNELSTITVQMSIALPFVTKRLLDPIDRLRACERRNIKSWCHNVLLACGLTHISIVHNVSTTFTLVTAYPPHYYYHYSIHEINAYTSFKHFIRRVDRRERSLLRSNSLCAC